MSKLFIIFIITVSFCFSTNSNVISDTNTNLMWQDNANTKKLKLNYQEATNHCKSLNTKGHNDWRLPTLSELESIMDKTQFNPAIKSDFKYTNTYDWYWSSTQQGEQVFIVLYYRGYRNLDNKSVKHNVRCVRDIK